MKRIHIINAFQNPFGGSEQRALVLYEMLRKHAEVRLWSDRDPAPHFTERYPIGNLSASSEIFPEGDTVVIVGAYFQAEALFARLRPCRLIYVYNTPSPNLFRERLELVRRQVGVEPEIVYAWEKGAEEVGLPGRLEVSPIDLQRFHPAGRRKGARGAAFTIGRMSRDDAQKHHAGDVVLYREAVRRGWRLRLMGATCLAPAFEDLPAVREALLPCGTEAPERFLATLDCFYYRVSRGWTEAYGRVVAEAMAMGLPVVCDRRVGAAGLIEDGVDGFVISGAGEALTVLQRLSDDAELCEHVGLAARRKVEQVYSEDYEKELVAYYTA